MPSKLKFDDGTPVKNDWLRLTTTIFNAASNIAQYGGLAALSPDGLSHIRQLIRFYLDNAIIIKEALEASGLTVFGGTNAPYLWVDLKGKKSWEAFSELLENHQILTTPGSGFGASGEGFLRFSAFAQRKNVLEGAARLRNKPYLI